MKNKVPWSLAAKNGLLLSIITVVIEVPVTMFQNVPDYLSILLSFIKIAGSYTLLHYFTRNYTHTLENAGYSDGFKFALATSFFSSIVCTLATLLTATVLVPDMIPNLLDQMFAMWESMGMGDAFDYQSMLKMMPAVLSFSKMLSCMFCGVIFSLIIANFTKTALSPFDNQPQ